MYPPFDATAAADMDPLNHFPFQASDGMILRWLHDNPSQRCGFVITRGICLPTK